MQIDDNHIKFKYLDPEVASYIERLELQIEKAVNEIIRLRKTINDHVRENAKVISNSYDTNIRSVIDNYLDYIIDIQLYPYTKNYRLHVGHSNYSEDHLIEFHKNIVEDISNKLADKITEHIKDQLAHKKIDQLIRENKYA